MKPDAWIDEHLGRRLWQRRRQLGLTQGELARAGGVQFQQIQKYECGASAMSAQRLWRLANSLGVPVSYFFQGLAVERRPEPPAQTEETTELLTALSGLQAHERRRLLELMKAMTGELEPT